MKNEFINLLEGTQRRRVSETIKKLEELGFFEAPASTRFHLSTKGGLLQHSMNVCKVALGLRQQMIQMKPELADQLKEDSVIIATLLHDVCKANIYKSAIANRKNTEGRWEKVQGYEVDYTDLPLGHGEKSVIMLMSFGLEMTKDEMLAIRWHMTAWDLAFQSPEQKSNLQTAREIAPLCVLVQAADGLASSLLEK